MADDHEWTGRGPRMEPRAATPRAPSERRAARKVSAPATLLHGSGDAGQLVSLRRGVRLHRGVAGPLDALATAAARDGVRIRVCSAHRSFKAQLSIWNRKAAGRQTLLDSEGRRLDAGALEPDALIDAILRWSALPGASRHHWGTDLDVYDVAAVPPGYAPELTTDEAATRFAALHAWLDANMRTFGFYRPYAVDLGGVAPEPWHLSYAPLSREYEAAFSADSLRAVLEPADMALKERVLERLPELFERYSRRVEAPHERRARLASPPAAPGEGGRA